MTHHHVTAPAPAASAPLFQQLDLEELCFHTGISNDDIHFLRQISLLAETEILPLRFPLNSIRRTLRAAQACLADKELARLERNTDWEDDMHELLKELGGNIHVLFALVDGILSDCYHHPRLRFTGAS
ncbi:MAG: hypothetical protein COY40_01980 [Alphaproteobacteria bacterium CG_4_10_14_0_8_um_filter_53_9]|nr:MAG: hypothetical protein COY40_01980 [Alphaproteobacteria bacterium CG_4_10_14_0_8_um_filter_53_9]